MSFLKAVVLVIPNLSGGGAERVMVNMAGWWAARGTQVTLITFSANPTVYAPHHSVRRLFIDDVKLSSVSDFSARPVAVEVLPYEPEAGLPTWPAEAKNVACLRTLLLQMPSHAPVISFLPRMNLRTLLAAQGLGRRVFVSERVWPVLCPLGDEDERLRRAWYPTATRVLVQTRRCADEWAVTLVPPERIGVIPNAFMASPSCGQDNGLSSFPRPFLLAGGRLEHQKNFAALIDAFAEVAPLFPNIDLVILGDGPLRLELEAHIAVRKLADRIHLIGFVAHPTPYYRHALAFVLSSLLEGFPNILLEAMGEGCPVVAFDCPTGPAEIVRHEIDGLLVPPGDTAALGAALARLLQDDELRARFSRCAVDVRKRFFEDAIMEQWNKEITQ